jgi:hypothetical protein
MVINKRIENPCYDTISIYYRFDSEEEYQNYLSWIKTRLERSAFKKINDTNALILIGWLKNIRVTVSRSGVTITGSLCKFFNGNNYYSMSRNQTMLCILSLQVALGLSLQNAIVRRIDFGCCLIMNAQPENYFTGLGMCGKYKSWQREHSLYYETGYKSLIFYNKNSEMMSDRYPLLPDELYSNTLRYEIRLKRQINYQLNREQVLVQHLYDISFYNEMIMRWAKEYELIHKNQTLQPLKNQLTAKDGIEYTLASLMILQGTNNVTRLISVVKDKFTQGSYARYQKKLKSLKFLSKESELITELNEKILQIKGNAIIIASDEE